MVASDYPKVQAALQTMLLGDGPYFKVIVEDSKNDKFGHIIVGYQVRGGSRKVVLCELKQTSKLSIMGILLTLGGAAAFYAWWNPVAALAFAISKCVIDYGF